MAPKAEIEAAVAAAGGIEHIARNLADFTRRSRLLNDRLLQLLKTHPNEWVAMPEDDELVFADSRGDLISKLREAGKPISTAVIRFLNPNPRVLIV
ncbi:MAG: hypothetical protein OXN15_03815 [Chloroflexota bacterium]|nr:hypothetical protein [Chloroflexota bacterium]MDE2969183.1 hypothetical protein [Chloroflexota bacterium]